MNLCILVDLEGIRGICSREQIVGDRISEGRLMMTEDINTCIDAAKEIGVKKFPNAQKKRSDSIKKFLYIKNKHHLL